MRNVNPVAIPSPRWTLRTVTVLKVHPVSGIGGGSTLCTPTDEPVDRPRRQAPPANGGSASTTDVSIWRSGMSQYVASSSSFRAGDTRTKPWRS